MRIGLIGAGNISRTHARAVTAIAEDAGAELAAVFAPNRASATRLAEMYRIPAFHDLASFLAHRPMEMVIIGSPSGLHAEQGIAAAGQGLHVLVEKPLDVTTARADQLIAACDAAGVSCGVVFQERYQPAPIRLKSLVASGGLGRLLLVSAQVRWWRAPEYYTQSRWHGTRALDGGGALMNQGIHTLDLLLWLLGDVSGVQARTARVLHQLECEDTALALLDFASGAQGVLEVTTAAYPGYPRRIALTGTVGTVLMEGDRIVAADLYPPRPGLVMAGDEMNPERAASAQIHDSSAHQAAIRDFILAARAGTPLACDAREGRRSLELAERIYAAAAAAETGTGKD